jgi:hypothetical protein
LALYHHHHGVWWIWAWPNRSPTYRLIIIIIIMEFDGFEHGRIDPLHIDMAFWHYTWYDSMGLPHARCHF